jgi:hypothetical protein
MANTTFTGAVRSQNGFEVVSKNTTTGAFTTSFTLDASGLQVAPVSVSDGNVTIAAATNAGRVNLVPAPSQDNTYTLPTPEAGVAYRFVFAGAAAASSDAIFDTGIRH